MTTATETQSTHETQDLLTAARQDRARILKELVVEVASGSYDNAEIIRRCAQAGIDVDTLADKVNVYKQRKQAFDELARLEGNKRKADELLAQKQKLEQQRNDLVKEFNERIEREFNAPIRRIQNEAIALNDSVRHVSYQAAQIRRRTDDPEITRQLTGAVGERDSTKSAIRHRESEIAKAGKKLERREADLENERYLTETARAAITRDIEQLRHQVDFLTSEIEPLQERLPGLEQRVEDLIARKNDPLAFAVDV